MKSPELSENDWQNLKEGIRLYNEGHFWEAHEEWELVWRRHMEDWRLFIQGLIQMTAALHQLQRGIYHGTVKHLRNAKQKLEHFPDEFLALNNDELVQGLEYLLHAAKAAGSDGIERLQKEDYPKIALKHDE